ncbi:hypothetical protein DVH05_008956 [Phytophthora capsici]|nr:hypothetical protein DVH05_008956 [Phytophthora capsici]|eukprot:jgi/Phyca11/117270/e_gw1.32.312.1
MLVHEAVWIFASAEGSIYAKEYVRKRSLLTEADRQRMDKKWLLRPGGSSLRKAWLSLPRDKRINLMKATPDPNFPFNDTGIVDGRKFRRLKDTQPSASEKMTHISNADLKTKETSELKVQVMKLRQARSRFFSESYKEALVKLQLDYDRGSMAGVIAAATSAVENAILYSRLTFTEGSTEDAFRSVAEHVSRVFGAMRTISLFPPEHNSDSDDMVGESEVFSKKILTRVYSEYQKAAESVSDKLMAGGVPSQGHDEPLLPLHSRYFTKTASIRENDTRNLT